MSACVVPVCIQRRRMGQPWARVSSRSYLRNLSGFLQVFVHFRHHGYTAHVNKNQCGMRAAISQSTATPTPSIQSGQRVCCARERASEAVGKRLTHACETTSARDRHTRARMSQHQVPSRCMVWGEGAMLGVGTFAYRAR